MQNPLLLITDEYLTRRTSTLLDDAMERYGSLDALLPPQGLCRKQREPEALEECPMQDGTHHSCPADEECYRHSLPVSSILSDALRRRDRVEAGVIIYQGKHAPSGRVLKNRWGGLTMPEARAALEAYGEALPPCLEGSPPPQAPRTMAEPQAPRTMADLMVDAYEASPPSLSGLKREAEAAVRLMSDADRLRMEEEVRKVWAPSSLEIIRHMISDGSQSERVAICCLIIAISLLVFASISGAL